MRRERDRLVLAKWQAASENGNTSAAEDESLAAPPYNSLAHRHHDLLGSGLS
jgi:hypothetical protein